MPVIEPTTIAGVVDQVLVNNRPESGLESDPVESIRLGFGGIENDAHSGLTRPSCVRVKSQYPVGTEIRNCRQLSIVSATELSEIARALDLETLDPGWLGANLKVSGIPDFTLIPPSTRLLFSSGAALVVDCENRPCKYPGEIIERNHPGKGKAFIRAAGGLRGVTAWVEKPGIIARGDRVEVHIPPQRLWSPAGVDLTAA